MNKGGKNLNKVYISKEKAELIHGEETALAHFGVKGMKWGVRKEREPTGGSAFSRRDRVVGSKKGVK